MTDAGAPRGGRAIPPAVLGEAHQRRYAAEAAAMTWRGRPGCRRRQVSWGGLVRW